MALKIKHKYIPVPTDVAYRLLLRRHASEDPERYYSFVNKEKTPSLFLFKGDDGKLLWKDFSSTYGGDLDKLITYMYPDKNRLFIYQRMYKAYVSGNTKGIPELSGTKKRRRSLKIQSYRLEKGRDVYSYFRPYHIDKQLLVDFNAYRLADVRLLSRKGELFLDCAIGYFENDGRLVQLYKPSGLCGDHKMFFNLTRGSYKKSPYNNPADNNIAMICSSIKDMMCLSKALKDEPIDLYCQFGEQPKLYSEELKSLLDGYRSKYVLYDNDKHGVLSSFKLAGDSDFIPIFVEKVKDAADYCKEFGVEALRDLVVKQIAYEY